MRAKLIARGSGVPGWRRIFLVMWALALFLPSCGEDEVFYDESAPIDLARRFHNAVLSSDQKSILELVDYPFLYDRRQEVRDVKALGVLLEKHLTEMRSRARYAKLLEDPSTRVEVISFQELLDGKEVNGRSFTEEEAVKAADKIHLRSDGFLVRVYKECRKTGKRSPKDYYLVMHPSVVGDLKITTYYD